MALMCLSAAFPIMHREQANSMTNKRVSKLHTSLLQKERGPFFLRFVRQSSARKIQARVHVSMRVDIVWCKEGKSTGKLRLFWTVNKS